VQVTSPDIARSTQFYGGRMVLTAPFQIRPGTASQVTSIFCPVERRPISGSSTKVRTSIFERIAFLQQQVSGLHIGALLDGKSVDDAIEKALVRWIWRVRLRRLHRPALRFRAHGLKLVPLRFEYLSFCFCSSRVAFAWARSQSLFRCC